MFDIDQQEFRIPSHQAGEIVCPNCDCRMFNVIGVESIGNGQTRRKRACWYCGKVIVRVEAAESGRRTGVDLDAL